MKKKQLFRFANLLFTFFVAMAAAGQEYKSNPADDYTKVITGRADNIVNAMVFPDDSVKIRVRDIIVAHYRFLNDTEENRDRDIAGIRDHCADNKELRDVKIDLRKARFELDVRDHHFAFYAQLKNVISEEQIDQVKDGLTYGVLKVTYDSYCDMIPDLTEEEKSQIMAWLIEAREHAIDGGSSREKHGWFGKYKGRINNYLSQRGYDLQAERKEWEKRLE